MKNKKWYHFQYVNGGRPYIAFTENKKRAIFRKYGGRKNIRLIKKDTSINYYIINIEGVA